MKAKPSNHYYFLVCWLLIDLFLVAMHLFTRNQTNLFHLDAEQNIPTLYQSAKLLFAGGLIFTYLWFKIQILERIKKHELYFFAPLAAILIFIGLDELGQIHENIHTHVIDIAPNFADQVMILAQSLGYSSTEWLIYYAPFIMLSIPYFVYATFYVYKKYKHRWWLILGMAISFIIVIILELHGTSKEYPHRVYEMFFITEEFFEMIGGSLGLFFVWLIIKEFEKKYRGKYGTR